MEYEPNITVALMWRTAQLVLDYQGEYDARTRINCRTGLLIVQRERPLKRGPADLVTPATPRWGLEHRFFKAYGNRRTRKRGDEHVPVDYEPNSLRGIVRSLRNAVAHFNIQAVE